MRVFVAGASGAVGRRLVDLLVEAGHTVWGTTRRPRAARMLSAKGAAPVVVDVYDADALCAAVTQAAPDAVIHQLTDLAAMDFAANGRLRTAGTPNLVAAAAAVAALDWPAGTFNVVDDEPAQGTTWVPAYCRALGAPAPPLDADAPATGRPISNRAARELGWRPSIASWRSGFARQ